MKFCDNDCHTNVGLWSKRRHIYMFLFTSIDVKFSYFHQISLFMGGDVRIKYDCEHSLFQAWPVQEKWLGYTCCSGRSLLCCLGINPIHNARCLITSKLD